MSDRMKEQPSKSFSQKSSAVDKYRELQQRQAKARGALTWGDAPAEDLRDMIACVTADGAAILLSVTSDGGALVVRTIVDKESVPFYAPDTASLNSLMSEVQEMFK